VRGRKTRFGARIPVDGGIGDKTRIAAVSGLKIRIGYLIPDNSAKKETSGSWSLFAIDAEPGGVPAPLE
jgi:hypothetical protein